MGMAGRMELRARIGEALKSAMREKEVERLSTLRLINAAIKDRDIALRGEGREDGVTEAEVMQILGKMVKQRQESVRAYEEGGRLELAEKEAAEIRVIEEFLPRQLSGRRDRGGGGRGDRVGRRHLDPRHGPGDGRAEGAVHRTDGFLHRRPDGQGAAGLSGQTSTRSLRVEGTEKTRNSAGSGPSLRT